MNKQLLFLLVIILIGCTNSENKDLKSNPSITRIFTESEIRDLNTICNFFNSQICKNNNSEIESLDDCYSTFFKRMKESYLDGGFELEISFDEQLDLYNNISDSTFNNLWVFNKCWISGHPDTLRCIGYKYDGKVEQLLKDLSSESPALYNYYDTFKLTGTITPTMISDFAVLYENFKIDDIRAKLLVVLHYLTLNDELNRNKEIKSAPNNGEHS